MSERDFEVQSYRGPYQVRFVGDAGVALGGMLGPGDRIVVDARVADLFAEKLAPALGVAPTRVIDPNEQAKSYEAIGETLRWLIEGGYKRSGRVVAIGGGIIQDVTAFASSILFRGVDWIFVPTNLLSQCDSCIGSKTSVNFESYKNQLGGFHPPRTILIDTSFLDTLGELEIRSGIGEMLHYFLIDGRESFDHINTVLDDALTDRAVLRDLIHRSLSIKKRMIEVDEFDQGPRNIFNFGHSFGHALESFTGYALPHGIAVSYGMDMACRLSWRLGLLGETDFQELRALLSRNWTGFPAGPHDLDRYVAIMAKDKKNVDAELRLILTRGLGDMFIRKVPVDRTFRENLESCFAHYEANSIP